MANTCLRLDGYVVSKTVKGAVMNRAGQVAYGTSFEDFGTGSRTWSDYQITMTETDIGASGCYRGSFPSVAAGFYKRLYFDSAISSQPIASDAKFDFQWDGSSEVTASGVGDYEVLLRIRTTGGSALAGAQIWLSLDNDRSNIFAGPLTTNSTGQVTFNCDYGTTYYIHGKLSGYNWLTASFTPASGSVTFTKDIASAATVSGEDSDYADALLTRMLARVRKWAVEPKVDKLYSDAYCIERAENAYVLALGEKRRPEQDPIVATVTVTFTSGTYKYILPSTMGPVWAIYYRDSTNDYGFKWFYTRNGPWASGGHGIWVEGHTLRIQSGFDYIDTPLTVEMLPKGCARLNCGTCTLDTDGEVATLAETPYLGTIDRAVNAYAGSIFRVFNLTGSTTSGNSIQERVVASSSYDDTNVALTLEKALDPIPETDDGYIFYEIAPQIPVGLDDVLAMRVAWEINSLNQPKKAQPCLDMYNANLRNIRLDAWISNVQHAGEPNADSFQNQHHAANMGLAGFY